MSKSAPHILFVCPYPFDEAPSQRFRFEQYLKLLKLNGFRFTIAPFFSEKAWNSLYREGSVVVKVTSVISSYLRRLYLLFFLKKYSFIFIHREASPLGPPFFEWVAKHLWNKKIIYDFDDAIWLDDPNEKGSFKALAKWKSKIAKICKWSYKVSCGNKFLATFALNYNQQTIINPTTIDTSYHKPEAIIKPNKKLVVGWTGTHSTLQYLESIIGELRLAYEQQPFQLLVIANKAPTFYFPDMQYVPWSKKNEIDALRMMDIGLMPLSEDPWSKGKCGFKALQYMALKKPVVASPIGVNKKIVPNGGLLIESEKEWSIAVCKLLNDRDLRLRYGEQGRMYVKNNYSTKSNANNFLSLFS